MSSRIVGEAMTSLSDAVRRGVEKILDSPNALSAPDDWVKIITAELEAALREREPVAWLCVSGEDRRLTEYKDTSETAAHLKYEVTPLYSSPVASPAPTGEIRVWEIASEIDDYLRTFENFDGMTNGQYEEVKAIIQRHSPKALPGWQPIETAPKDGTSILICGGTYYHDNGGAGASDDYPLGVEMARWYHDDWYIGCGKAYDDEMWANPTHWMPLPAAPGEGK